MKVSRCKGTRDLTPQEMAKFRHIEGVFRNCCLGWGYEEVRTPTLEYLQLFTSAGTLTPSMLGRVFSFLDWNGWSGERVVLRPEGTIPAARLYAQSLQHRSIARLFYVQNVFAFEEIRERWQGGAELIGESKPEADVELISLASENLSALGVAPVEIRLSHAGVLKAFFKGLRPEGMPQDVLDRVLAGDTKVLNEMGGKMPGVDRRRLLFGLKGNSPAFAQNLKSIFSEQSPEVESSLDNLARVAELLTALGYSYQIDLASGPGFEYYTGIIFEFYRSGLKLGGGGRYDELLPLICGRDIPASGFALSVDRLMNLVQVAEPAPQDRVLVGARSGSLDELRACFEIARLLRGQGYLCELGSAQAGAFRWSVSVQSEGGVPVFELTDLLSGKKQRTPSAAEVLRSLEEARCR